MMKLQFGKVIGGVGAGALLHFLEQKYGESNSLTSISTIVPIALAGASVLGFVPKIGGIGKIIGSIGEASTALVAYKLLKNGMPTTSSTATSARIFHRSVSPVNTYTGDMSLSGL